MNEYTFIKEAGIWQCNDCGAYAAKREDVKHYDSCMPGESKKWEEFYGREENNV